MIEKKREAIVVFPC